MFRGTPDPNEWPGITELTGYKPDFPQYQKEELSKHVPGLSEEGMNLLEAMLIHDPNKRISAKDALKHPYLKDVPDSIKNMK